MPHPSRRYSMTATTATAPPQAAAMPPVARLMQSTNAFLVSRCLYVAAEVGVADHIAEAPQTTRSLAESTRTNEGALYRILRVLASHGVFEAREGGWVHSEQSRLLRSDHPASMRDYIRMIGMPIFWHAWEHV